MCTTLNKLPLGEAYLGHRPLVLSSLYEDVKIPHMSITITRAMIQNVIENDKTEHLHVICLCLIIPVNPLKINCNMIYFID